MQRHIIYISFSIETLPISNVVIYFVFTNRYPLSNLCICIDGHTAKTKEEKVFVDWGKLNHSKWYWKKILNTQKRLKKETFILNKVFLSLYYFLRFKLYVFLCQESWIPTIVSNLHKVFIKWPLACFPC